MAKKKGKKKGKKNDDGASVLRASPPRLGGPRRAHPPVGSRMARYCPARAGASGARVTVPATALVLSQSERVTRTFADSRDVIGSPGRSGRCRRSSGPVRWSRRSA